MTGLPHLSLKKTSMEHQCPSGGGAVEGSCYIRMFGISPIYFPFDSGNLVHLPTSRRIFTARKMNIVNIRTAPINTIHKGGLEVMSERKKDMTRVKKD